MSVKRLYLTCSNHIHTSASDHSLPFPAELRNRRAQRLPCAGGHLPRVLRLGSPDHSDDHGTPHSSTASNITSRGSDVYNPGPTAGSRAVLYLRHWRAALSSAPALGWFRHRSLARRRSDAHLAAAWSPSSVINQTRDDTPLGLPHTRAFSMPCFASRCVRI